jgi:hypothetical protein
MREVKPVTPLGKASTSPRYRQIGPPLPAVDFIHPDPAKMGEAHVATAERACAPSGQLGTTAHAIHQSFWGQAVAREDRLVALQLDRVGQLAEHLADELIRVPRVAEDPRRFLVRSELRVGGHATRIRARSQARGYGPLADG